MSITLHLRKARTTPFHSQLGTFPEVSTPIMRGLRVQSGSSDTDFRFHRVLWSANQATHSPHSFPASSEVKVRPGAREPPIGSCQMPGTCPCCPTGRGGLRGCPCHSLPQPRGPVCALFFADLSLLSSALLTKGPEITLLLKVPTRTLCCWLRSLSLSNETHSTSPSPKHPTGHMD